MPRKPTEAGPGIPVALRMPREMHDEIVKAAGDQSVGEEIRKRLAVYAALMATQDQEVERDDRELLAELIEVLARTIWGIAGVQRPGGGRFFDAVERAIKRVLASYRPKGDAAVLTSWGELLGTVEDADAAATWGLALGLQGRKRRDVP